MRSLQSGLKKQVSSVGHYRPEKRAACDCNPLVVLHAREYTRLPRCFCEYVVTNSLTTQKQSRQGGGENQLLWRFHAVKLRLTNTVKPEGSFFDERMLQSDIYATL